MVLRCGQPPAGESGPSANRWDWSVRDLRQAARLISRPSPTRSPPPRARRLASAASATGCRSPGTAGSVSAGPASRRAAAAGPATQREPGVAPAFLAPRLQAADLQVPAGVSGARPVDADLARSPRVMHPALSRVVPPVRQARISHRSIRTGERLPGAERLTGHHQPRCARSPQARTAGRRAPSRMRRGRRGSR